jgi:diphosphomevalonate decarboxylase
MTGKSTVIAPSNIALIKYWGTRDVIETLPYNRSLSMTLSRCTTTTTVQVLEDSDRDMVFVGSDSTQLRPATEAFARGVTEHLDRLRTWAELDCRFRIGTVNNFPMGTGIASSASGFAALTLAVIAALGRQVSPEKASILARLSGSGSAARSVMGGYVEWPGHEDGSAAAIADARHWDLRDLIAIVDESEKEVSSKQGHRLAPSSPYFELRLKLLEDRLERIRRSILDQDFASLAPIVEEEAVDLHLIAMSSQPPVFYWQPGTLNVLKLIRDLRGDGVEVCATMDAGANVHAICTSSAAPTVAGALESTPEVLHVIPDGVGEGPMTTDDHLL